MRKATISSVIRLLILSNICFTINAQQITKTFVYDAVESVPRSHNVDITNILIDVSILPNIGKVEGTVTHTFTPLQNQIDSIFLDAPGITILGTTINTIKVDFKTNTEGVTIFPKSKIEYGKTYQLAIKYEAQPRLGLYFVGWNDSLNLSRKQVWTQGQAYDNRYWVPLYDKQNDKATTEVKVKFDAQYQVLSNGSKLSEKTNGDGTKTWHYKLSKPHSAYLIMIGIGKYSVKTVKSKGGVPINLWYYPEFPERVAPTYIHSADMMDWFEQELGVKYAWGSYSQIPVQDYTFGAMENTSATLFGDFYLVDNRSFLDKPYLYVNAHELTHQWFGDLVTERTETHHWLQESFATYYGNLYTGTVTGEDYYSWNRKTSIDLALTASKTDLLPIAHSKAGTTRHYPKGAVVLDMLRYVVGNQAFRKTMTYYLQKHAYQNVVSSDLLAALHETTGLSLDWFWEEWIYRGGEPSYEVSFKETNSINAEKFSEFTIRQTHATNELIGLFTMPIWFEVYYKNGTVDRKQVIIDKYQQTIEMANSSKLDIDFVLFDPNMKVMKSVNFVKSFEMLLAQAQRAPNMLDQYDALVALRKYPIAEKQSVLISVYNKEKFHALKAEILYQLKDLNDFNNLELYRKAIADKDVDVRKAVLTNTTLINDKLKFEYEKLLTDSSYVIVEQSLDKLCLSFPENCEDYLRATYKITGTRGNNVRIKWLEIKAKNDRPKYAYQVSVYAGRSYEFLTRVAAINVLRKLNFLDAVAIANLFDGALNANNKLSAEAVSAIKYFYSQYEYRKAIENYYNSQTWLPWQKMILTKAGL
jgi:aminopeptidase N